MVIEVKNTKKKLKANLKSICWPKSKEAVKRTLSVLAFSVIAGGAIALVDGAAGHVIGMIISVIA